MNRLKAPSLQSLESDRSNESLFTESFGFEIEELDDAEYSLPVVDTMLTLESVLNDLDGEDCSNSDLGAPGTTFPPISISIECQPRIGSHLRHVILQGISTQVSSASDRVGAGLACSVAVQDMIAVGTSHGHVLAFDVNQTLRWCCRDYTDQGAVSALAFNDISTRLLVGYARGHVIMIDTSSGDSIRSLSNVITPNTGVLHVKWIGRGALCSDSGGSVWTLNFTRRLGIRGCDSQCLFSGARGEVCCMEPLILNDPNHPLQSFTIVALATLSKFFVVTIRPRLKIIKFQSLTGQADCLPLLAWQMVLIQAADASRTIDPVLAAARGDQLFFHQVTAKSGKVSLLFLRHIILSYSLLSMHWLGPKSIAMLDRAEILHLVDVRTNREMDCLDMVSAGLVYNSAQFKAFATGGNVSPAFALAGSMACYNSIVSHGSFLYVLGARSLQVVSIRSWVERISHLVENQKWVEAIDLAIDGYRSLNDRPRRQAIAKGRILQLIEEYIEGTSNTPEHCLDAVMKCLIEIGETDLLWKELWDRLKNTNYFLAHITEFVENGNITKVSPCVAQSLCNYWQNISPHRLEEIILRLDWQCLDLHQVLTIAKKEKLYRAQIYLNTKALGDFTSSITELIPLIDQDNTYLGNCLLVYISSCLAGRYYPNGELDSSIVLTVKHEVLRCLTTIHSNGASDAELSYPYLRTLLKFDIRETLNVISLAFQEKEFSGELGASYRQIIVNILLEILRPESASFEEIGCLFHFISQQIASKSLPHDDTILENVVKYLQISYNETSRQHFEREQAWLELLNSDCLQHIPFSEMIRMAEKSNCYRVMEYLYEITSNFDSILQCYLQVPSRQEEMFTYIRQYANIPKRKIYQQIYSNFSRLLEINADEIIRILIENYDMNIKSLIKLVKQNQDSKQTYTFLDKLLKNLWSLETEECENYIQLLCQYHPENVESFLRSNDQYRLDTVLDILRKYQLNEASMVIYEKQGDYQSAFNIALELLKEAPESVAETSALQVASLCIRVSDILPENQKEELWFSLLRIVLLRSDLTSITKNILHAAGKHVNLSKLVQLVLTSRTRTENLGDIKHLLMGMLSYSQYENLLITTTARILGQDLHSILVKENKLATRGVFVKSIKCDICILRLKSANTNNIIIFGNCGHAVHEGCVPKDNSSCNNTFQCPLCREAVTMIERMRTSQPKLNRAFNFLQKDHSSHCPVTLQTCAPPRIGL